MGDAYRASGPVCAKADRRARPASVPDPAETLIRSRPVPWPQVVQRREPDRAKQALYDAFNGTGQPTVTRSRARTVPVRRAAGAADRSRRGRRADGRRPRTRRPRTNGRRSSVDRDQRGASRPPSTTRAGRVRGRAIADVTHAQLSSSSIDETALRRVPVRPPLRGLRRSSPYAACTDKIASAQGSARRRAGLALVASRVLGAAVLRAPVARLAAGLRRPRQVWAFSVTAARTPRTPRRCTSDRFGRLAETVLGLREGRQAYRTPRHVQPRRLPAGTTSTRSRSRPPRAAAHDDARVEAVQSVAALTRRTPVR